MMLATAKDGSHRHGTLVASKVQDHATTLSQAFFCGFPLPMPALSVLGSDAIEVNADPVSNEAELNFDFFLSSEDSAQRSGVCGSTVRADREVSSDAWLVRLRREGERIRHLLRKYGDDACC